MPLPSAREADQLAWPPKKLDDYFTTLRLWSAWYSGGADDLAQVYETYAQRNTRRPKVRPTQYNGGLVGQLSRWFWGQPPTEGEKRTKLHIPLASDIAATSARLLFSEPPTVRLPKDHAKNTATQKRLDELVDDGMHATLREGAEVDSALGGVYLRVQWDTEVVPDRPWITAVHADGAVPEWTFDRLQAVTFWRVIAQDGDRTVVRHLERHERGAIHHGVYEGNATQLGRPVPLTEYEETTPLAEALGAAGHVETGIDKLTVVYVPNIRPNRLWRNTPAAAYCGRSDFHLVEPIFDALDETYTSWMRDIRVAKARLVVPSVYLQDLGPGRGAYFNPDREVYETLNMLPGSDGSMQMQAHQFAIRVEEHERTALMWTRLAVETAGYSAQTFGLTGEVAITATEVAARERKSFITRDDKILYWRPALRDLLETLLLVDKTHFKSTVDPVRPDLTFGDTVSQDPKAMAETLSQLEAARAVSIETKVRLVHAGDPDWDDQRIAREVEAIKAESGGAPVEDPGTFRGNDHADQEQRERQPQDPASQED